MAKEKATITVDRDKLAEAREMLGVRSASAAIDIALSEVIRRMRLRRDVEAYRKLGPTTDEIALGEAQPQWEDLADDTDWDTDWPTR